MKKLILICTLFLSFVTCYSVDVIWTGASSSSWHLGSNWQGGVVPNSNDVAIFKSTHNVNVIVTSNTSVKGIRVEQGYTGTITKSGATLTVGTSGYVYLAKSLINSSADITLKGYLENDNGSFTYTIDSQPQYGVLTVSGTNAHYQPNANYYGLDTFTYHVYNGTSNSPVVTVKFTVDDNQEVNDTSATAKDLTTALTAANDNLILTNLAIIANNLDWFKFTVTERSELDLLFLFSPGNGDKDLDVYLYNSSLSVIGQGETGNDNEQIIVNDLPIGTYYIKIMGWAGATNLYEMRLVRTTYDPDDRFEVNDTQATAANLTTALIDESGQLFENNLNIISNNVDFYKVTLSGVSNLITSLTFTHASGNLDLQVLDSNSAVLATANSTTNNESLTLNSLPAGDYFIKVYGVASAQNVYNMVVQASVYFTEDTYEANDTKATAWNITSNIINGNLQIDNLRLNSYSEDWFKFTISAESVSSINVLFTPGNGEYDLDIALENDAGTVLAEGLSGSPNENLSLTLAPGTYYLQVYGWSNSHNDYALNMVFTPTNQAPTANNQNVSVSEDNAINISLTGSDPESQPLTYTVTSSPANGILTGTGTSQTYTPNANFNGTDFFTFTVSDGVLTSATATISITINPINDTPAAQNQTVTVIYNSANSFALNSNDIDGDTLTFTIDVQPLHGVLTINGTSANYQPSTNYYGSDVFTYHVNDASSSSATATVNIKVDDAKEANDTSATAKDLTADLNAGNGILNTPNLIILPNNDDWFKFTVTERSEIDILFLFSPGNGDKDLDVYLYNSSLTEIGFSETGYDNEHMANHDLAIGTYYIKVIGWNGASNIYEMRLNRITYDPDDRFEPNDSLGTAADLTTNLINAYGQLFENELNILTNNEDFYKVTLSATSNLIVSLSFVNANGNLGLQILDSVGTILGTSNTTTNAESLTLNSLVAGDYIIKVYGVAGAQNEYSMVVQAPIYIPEDSYEPNDTKATAWDITSSIVSGNLQINSLRLNSFNEDWFKFTLSATASTNIDVLFTPGNGEFDLDVSLENTAGTVLAEGLSGSSNENLSLTLAPGTYYLQVYGWSNAHNNYALNMTFGFTGNQPPIANNQNVSVSEDNAINITLTGSDPEGQPLTYTVVTNPLHGSLTGTGSSRTYTPVANYNGADSFTFTVSDGVNTSSSAIVNINVSAVDDPITAVADSISVSENVAFNFNPTTNDTNVDSGDVLSITATTNGTKGSTSFSGNTITYTPTPVTTGSDSFTYTITDGHGNFSTATVSVTINHVNNAPIAVANSISTNEDTPFTFDPVTNDTDADNDTLTITSKTNGTKGSVSFVGNNVTYTPNANLNGSDSFTYSISDGNGGSSTGTVDVTIVAVNDAPVAQNQTITVVNNISNSLVLINSDVEDDTLTYIANTQPINGVLTMTATSATYQPTTGYYGLDSFTYHVNDGNANSAIVTISLKVDDAQELNDTFATAKDITSALNAGNGVLNMPNLVLLANNEDWFQFTVTERSEIDLSVLFTPGNGDKNLDVYLINSSMSAIDAGTTSTPNEQIVIDDLAIGTYYIKVIGLSGASNSYAISLTRTTYNPEDIYEPNDTQGTAYDLTSNLVNAGGQLPVNSLFLLSNNLDYYKVTLNGTSSLNTSITFVNANGNLDLSILNSTGTIIGTSSTNSNTETVNFASLPAGDYFIKVNGVSSAENNYTMVIQANVYFMPVVLTQFKFEAFRNGPFSFDLAAHINYAVMGDLSYELLNPNSIPGLSVSSVGVISTADVGNVIGGKDFTVNVTDSFNHLVTVQMSLFVVEILLNPNGIVELNNSKITIVASGLGDTPVVLLRDKLLAESGHDAEWLDVSFARPNLLSYFGITNLANLPSKIMVTITPNEKFQSENIAKVGLGLLNANGVFSRLYETSDKTFTGYYNRYEMTLNSQELVTSGIPFTQGLNKVVMFTQLANGIVTYYSGAQVQTSVTPYLRSTLDTSRSYTPVGPNFQYNYILGFANGLFVDTTGPELAVFDTYLQNNKITVAGSIIDEIGADFVDATISIKNGSNVYVPIDPSTYLITKSVSNGIFTLEISDKDANTSISLLSLGSQVRINLSAKDFFGNVSNSDFIDLNYYPVDEIVRIDSLTAVSTGVGIATVAYQASILDAGYQLDSIKINEVVEANQLTNSLVKSSQEGTNYYKLTIKVKNTANPAIVFEISKTVTYKVIATVSIQNFSVSGNANTNYGMISSGSNSRNITFEVVNPNHYPLTVKLSVFNHFTYETTDLNVVEYEPGKYKATSDYNLLYTQYDLNLKVSTSDGLVSLSATPLAFQNGPFALVSSGPFSLANPPSLTLIPAGYSSIFYNGVVILPGVPLTLNGSGENTFTVAGQNFTSFVMANGYNSAVDSNGLYSGQNGFDPDKTEIEITYPQAPSGENEQPGAGGTEPFQFKTPIIKTTDQFLRGTVLSKYQSVLVINNDNKKEVAAELKPLGNDKFEFSANLNFLHEGYNNLIIKAFSIATKDVPEKVKILETIILFDRNGPQITVNFGTNYDSATIPAFLGYLSFYNSLMVNGIERKQTDYEFSFEITENYFLGKTAADVVKRLSVQIGGIGNPNANLSLFDLTLSNEGKTLRGKLKDMEKVSAVGNGNSFSGNFYVKVGINDQVGNYGYKQRCGKFPFQNWLKMVATCVYINMVAPPVMIFFSI